MFNKIVYLFIFFSLIISSTYELLTQNKEDSDNFFSKIPKIKFINLSLEELKKLNIIYSKGTMNITLEKKILKNEYNRQTLLKYGYDPDEYNLYRKTMKFSINGVNSKYVKYSGWDQSQQSPLFPVAVSCNITRNDPKNKLEIDLFLFNNQSPYLEKDNILKNEIHKIIKEFLGKKTDNTKISDFSVINLLIPVKTEFKDFISYKGKLIECNFVYVFWFVPSKELIDLLPTEYAQALIKEFNIVEKINNGEISPSEAKDSQSVNGSYINLDNYRNSVITNAMIYPNPAYNDFNIKFKLNETREISIIIYELTGQLIPQDKYTFVKDIFQPGEHTIAIKFNNLSRGVYLISISTSKGEQVVQRLVID